MKCEPRTKAVKNHRGQGRVNRVYDLIFFFFLVILVSSSDFNQYCMIIGQQFIAVAV